MFAPILRELSFPDFWVASTKTGTIAAKAMPAMMMVTSNSTKLKPAVAVDGPLECLFISPASG